MKYTKNYHLKKPDGSDSYSVGDFNENAEILDEKLKEEAEKLQIQIRSLNSRLSFHEKWKKAKASDWWSLSGELRAFQKGSAQVLCKEGARLLSVSAEIEADEPVSAASSGQYALNGGTIAEKYRPLFTIRQVGLCRSSLGVLPILVLIREDGSFGVQILETGESLGASLTVSKIYFSITYPYGNANDIVEDEVIL